MAKRSCQFRVEPGHQPLLSQGACHLLFDWRLQEAKLNQFSHFRADVKGLKLHFIHEKGKGPGPIPLVLIHGWPSSFTEMLKVIPQLTDPSSYGGDPGSIFLSSVP